MDKRSVAKAVVTGVIVAELAVLDYAAWTMKRNGSSVSVSSEELTDAAEVAIHDMMEGE